MIVAFTLCSNNYFPQALALANSFLEHHPASNFYIILVDKRTDLNVWDNMRIRLIEVAMVETEILSLAAKYNIVELNTAVKPQAFLYLFANTRADVIYYLDPDVYIYQSFQELNDYLETYEVLLTPHILRPIPIDGKTPFENDFLNFGLYNLGFLGLKRSAATKELLHWWKERTYKYGYKNLAKGLFVDQLWMNFVPVQHEKVKIIDQPGYNMAPWNLHERKLSFRDDSYYVNNTNLLVFYHFSTLNPLKKLQLHPVFNRYDFSNRPDLLKIYQDYATELLNLGYAGYHNTPCYYIEWQKLQEREAEREALQHLPLKSRLFIKLKNLFPKRIRRAIHVIIGQ